MALLFYGAGLRLLEGARLRVQDIDFGANLIVVRNGKGAKDRVTMLPAAVKEDLARHLEEVRRSPRPLTADVDMTSTVKRHDDGGPRVPSAACLVEIEIEHGSSHRKRRSP